MNLIDESIYGLAIFDGKLDLHVLFKRLHDKNYLQYRDSCFSNNQQRCCVVLNGCFTNCQKPESSYRPPNEWTEESARLQAEMGYNARF